MAVMVSQPDPIALTEKSQSLNMATSTSAPLSEERNGLEVNGHVSPVESHPDATNNTKANHQDDASLQDPLRSTESSGPNHQLNKDAFVSNQNISTMTPPSADAAGVTDEAKERDSAKAGEVKDSAMVDAPTDSAHPPSPPTEPAAEASPEVVAEKPTEPAGPAEPSSMTAQSPTAAEPAEKSVKAQSSADADKDMPDAPVIIPEAGTEKAEDTQATAATEAPAGEVVSPSASLSRPAPDASQEAASAPVTADTSMTDAPSQTSAKITRERDDDVDGEPAAKRARTSGDDVGEVAQSQPGETVATDSVVTDQPARAQAPESTSKPALSTSPVPLSVNGQVRNLNDSALINNPITPYQNREIRKVLGLVKKTKSGQMFKASVQSLWPGVWEQYRQTISRPVDISVIEQKLRENSYLTFGQFRSDVELLLRNATTFNGANHMVTANAKQTRDQIYTRMGEVPAQEPVKSVKQEIKQMPTRHAEPRAQPTPKKEARPVASAPAEKVSDAPVYAIPPSGVPIIRRDSTKNDGDRPKRPIHPPKNKDFGAPPKNLKNKRKPELKFCEELLREVMHARHWAQNQWFLEPVDPVAMNIPTYHKVIKQPMDLGTMNQKLQNGEYESAKAFKADFDLMIKNCFKFNPEGHLVHSAGKELEKIFQSKWDEKTAWMNKHAQASAPPAFVASPRGGAKDESDEDEASEPEQDNAAEVQEAKRSLQRVIDRLKEEQDKLDKELYSSNTPDGSVVEMQRGMISYLQDEIMKRRTALNALQPDKKASQPKASNKKKSASGAGGGGGGGGGSKKTSGGAGGSSKKAGGGQSKKPAPKKRLSDQEKEIVSDAIGRLDGPGLEKAINIIKKDTNVKETEDDEIELDMDQLSDKALVELYELVIKAFPDYKEQLKKHDPAPAPSQGSGSAKSAKPKKNKPMSKAEQERRIEQLRELKNSYKRPGSGSQEPLPSVEGTDAVQAGHHHDDSDDASSSEEE